MRLLILILFLLLASPAAIQADTKLDNAGPTIKATITAYTDDPCENMGCGKPAITAIGTKIRPGIVAVSPDLIKSGWTYRKYIKIEDIGIFRIEDTTHPRLTKHVDVAVLSKSQARKFGRKNGLKVTLLDNYDPKK